MAILSDLADVVIVGDGVIGLSTAVALGAAGVTCVLIGDGRPGAASRAAAGLLAPNVGALPAAAAPFFHASLAQYDGFLSLLAPPAPVLLRGLIELDRAEPPPAQARLATPAEAAGLASAAAPLFHPSDAAIDMTALLAALRRTVATLPSVVMVDAEVSRIHPAATGATVESSAGRSLAGRVVLAAGAWATRIAGLPRELPVRPLKGQMLALEAAVLERPVVTPDVYLVPRGRHTLVGATSEEVGYDVTVTGSAMEQLRSAAARACPALDMAAIQKGWAGIRPATPDMLPIVGPDPAAPSLIYACGHSRNGVLLAPATAYAVRDLCTGQPEQGGLDAFSIRRFGGIESNLHRNI